MKQLWWLLKTATHSFVGQFFFQSTIPATSLLIRIEEKTSQELQKLPVLSCPGKLTINELISNVGIELL